MTKEQTIAEMQHESLAEIQEELTDIAYMVGLYAEISLEEGGFYDKKEYVRLINRVQEAKEHLYLLV
jgi:NTP pyrophosphatase (non-canonical NTP hydrolase)